jgi:hypothetical protein
LALPALNEVACLNSAPTSPQRAICAYKQEFMPTFAELYAG